MADVTSGQKGLAAVKSKQWDAAIPLLTRAIDSSAGRAPSPAWLLARAQALQQAGQPERALADAERAYTSALQRQQPDTRQLLALAQYRRAVALASLKRYADADACCVWSQQLIEGKNFRTAPDDVATHVDAHGRYLATADAARQATGGLPKPSGSPGGAPGADETQGQGQGQGQATAASATAKVDGGSEWMRAYMWRAMVLKQMEALPPDDPGRTITVPRVPEAQAVVSPTSDAAAGQAARAPPRRLPQEEEPKEGPKAAKPPSEQPPTETAGPYHKPVRVDFYQSATNVFLTLYVKGADAAKTTCSVDTDGLVTVAPLPAAIVGTAEAVVLRLSDRTEGAQSAKVKVTPYKVELDLAKRQPGSRWAAWGQQVVAKEAPASASAEAPATMPPVDPKVVSREEKSAVRGPAAPGLTYPWSTRGGPKDWDKVVAEASGTKPAADGKPGGADDDEDAGDVNGFFKTLYAGATPEQQRAMMKSFVESNGTSLSTDWASVKDGPVPTLPPDGVDVKKWE